MMRRDRTPPPAAQAMLALQQIQQSQKTLLAVVQGAIQTLTQRMDQMSEDLSAEIGDLKNDLIALQGAVHAAVANYGDLAAKYAAALAAAKANGATDNQLADLKNLHGEFQSAIGALTALAPAGAASTTSGDAGANSVDAGAGPDSLTGGENTGADSATATEGGADSIEGGAA